RLFSHIQTLSAPYFDRKKTGDLMAHATNDINNIRMAVGMGVVALTDAIFLGSAAIGFMLYIDPTLTAYAMIPMPVIILFTRIFGKKMHRMYTRVQATFSEMTEMARESFAGIRIVRAFNREEDEQRKLRDISQKYIGENMKLVNITGLFFPLMVFFTNISLAIVIVVGGRQAITARITPGDFVAFISYLNMIMWPMMAIGWVTNLIQRGMASLDRINAIMETEPEIRDLPDARPLDRAAGHIRFENVSFAFTGDSRENTIESLSIDIPAGSAVGIAGPPGSGKTTLMELLTRRYEATSGKITMDTVDIKNIKIADLHRQMALVPQEPYLFSGTIRDNILFGASPDEDLLQDVVQKAALDETLRMLPRGIDTPVGERGVILSGGQKQRIVLARALLRDCPVMLFDDPIGQVDTGTAGIIIRTIREMAGKKTVLIASHRIAATSVADRIIVMENGRIVEEGSHDQLVAQNGYYARAEALQRLESTGGAAI
ncbi:MAG: ABC transporter ATP-binding protein, partial [Thermodesulfobacteriota bacterium]